MLEYFIYLSVGGKILDRIEGAKVADMTKKVKELSDKVALKAKSAAAGPAAKSAPDFKALINAAPAMLFMKGSPDAPECKFSRATVDLLSSINAVLGIQVHQQVISNSFQF